MGKRGRGRERQVTCDKCGRTVRRDKALFIEQAVFTNPMDRKDVYDENYQRNFMRECCYCISCGKHNRLFEKKKKMLQARRERQQTQGFVRRPGIPRPMTARSGEKPAPASAAALQQPNAQKEATAPQKAVEAVAKTSEIPAREEAAGKEEQEEEIGGENSAEQGGEEPEEEETGGEEEENAASEDLEESAGPEESEEKS